MLIKVSDGAELYVKDWGHGRPVVLVHGWPLNADMWEWQMPLLVEHGFRVVAYDRRGFGRSSQPAGGYDYDTFASDLDAVLQGLDLRDVVLVGFSMGGGEVARYLARFGRERIARAVLLSAVTPFLLQTDDHPAGAPAQVFEGMIQGIVADRPAFFEAFGPGFYGVGQGRPVSEAVLRWTHGLAMQASPIATTACVRAFGYTDFRPDMAAFALPTLILHGAQDSIVPIDISARVAHAMIPGSELVVYDDAPHGLYCTHAVEVNEAIVRFARG